MKKEYAEILLYRFPFLFTYFIDTYGNNAIHQFSIADGWHPIMVDMCDELHDLKFKYFCKGINIKINFIQIKEKFGTLRAYHDTKVIHETRSSKRFRKIDEWIRTKMCKKGLYKIYWAMHRFRRKWIYETLYEKVSTIVGKAEEKSATTCEVCGELGKRCRPRFWILTLCEKHEKEEKERTEWKN